MEDCRQIILIMTDTQRADLLGCYGNRAVETPQLDRLAAGGLRFEKAYCCQPVCGPSRSAIFTGTYPHTNGVLANSMPLNQMSRTLGQRLQQQGFHTAYIGKWHLDGGDYFGYGECPPGWDPAYWYDMRCYLEELSEEDRLRSRRPATVYDDDFTAEFTYGHRCSSRAVDFLERFHHEEFLLVVSYDEPHDPALCPPEFIEKYRDYQLTGREGFQDKLKNKPEHHRAWAGRALQEDRSAFSFHYPERFGCNTFVDQEIGRVLAAAQEYAPGALVIYTSDHGESFGEHCLNNKGPAAYDEITRIPLIVSWPGVVPSGSVSSQPASHIDLLPTILEAAGLNIPPVLEGKSMLEQLIAPDSRPAEEVFMEFTRYEVDHDGFGGFQPLRCVFDGRYKLVINLLTDDELYDLLADPDEVENLILQDDYREIRDRLHDRLLEWMNETRDPFRGYYWERRPWREDAREASWDYTGMTRQRQADEGEKRQLDYHTGLEMTETVRKKD